MNNLSSQIKLDIFKCLKFDQLLSFQQTNRYFNKFIGDYAKELARAYFVIDIVHTLEHQYYADTYYKELNLEIVVCDLTVSDQLREKWQNAINGGIRTFLTFSESPCRAVVRLTKVLDCDPEYSVLLKLPHSPGNIKEMCIIRCWLKRLFGCIFKEAEFENIVFNPTLIKLLFEDETNPSLQFYTKQTTLRYCFADFELHAMKFVKDHLKKFKNLVLNFLCVMI
ncbi:hypothetical protein ACQ4LE_005291 [Meloidogyne hapla]|uniref:F-box domain-containing protein n=1 Tax=Meloidogyne hapla TaxID=6305 RepID=A0A1I8B4V1_MELHA